MKNVPTQLTLIALMIMALAANTLSQSTLQAAKNQNPQGGILTGRITIEGKPAAGFRVLLIPAGDTSLTQHALNILKLTDDDGKFRLAGVPAGSYILTVAAGAYIFQNRERSTAQGKEVIVHEGEEINNLDLALERGGIITGHISDANGQPVIGERVSLQLLDEKGRNRMIIPANQSGETDDRGIYRLYGLSAGKYKVSIGSRLRSGSIKVGPGGEPPVTYYPGVTDESKATLVEVQAGTKVDSIDITMAQPAETYNITGRVVDSETGQPIANMNCGYTDVTSQVMSNSEAACKTNANGEFRLEHIQPGRYAAFIKPDLGTDFYSVPTPFEVSSGDVQGLEIKVQRGSSISGTVVVEGVKDPTILSQLSQLSVYVVQPNTLNAQPPSKANVLQDASFHLTGVPPGKVSLQILPSQKRDFSLLRIEQNGIEQVSGIDIPAGESVSGVRLVLTYGKGSISGHIKAQNGTLPEGSRSLVGIASVSNPSRVINVVKPDLQGYFTINDLPIGDYELTVLVTMPIIKGTRPRALPPTKQHVTVKSAADTEVSVILDLSQMK